MASPKIKFKRSSVASKRPTLSNLELGELALNTYDGKVYLRQDTGGVGIATTVTSVNPWTENYGASGISYEGNVSVTGVITATSLDMSGGTYFSGITTTTTTAGTSVANIPSSTYRSASYQIQSTEGSKYQSTNIQVIHDGTDVYMTEYGKLETSSGIATFSATIGSGGSLELLAYAASSSSTTHKVLYTAIKV